MSIEQTVFSASELPFGPGVSLLNSNEDGLVALEKPVSVLSHPNREKDEAHSLLNVRYDYDNEVYIWKAGGVERRAWLVNRLDSPTSGVVLLALNEKLSRELKRQFATHMVSKTYYAVVQRTPSNHAGNWNDSLQKDVYRGGKLVKGGQRIHAKTRYQVSKVPKGGFPVALLKLIPVTGRTHQLRVQCSKHGHPIIGDKTYGSFNFNRDVAAACGVERMLLHSADTRVKYAYKGHHREFRAESPLPEAFEQVLRYRPGLLKTRISAQPAVSSKLAQRRFKR